MAATANATKKSRSADRASYPVAATTHIYDGQLGFVDSSGNATGSTNSGANQFAGIAVQEYDNSGGSAGDIDAEFHQSGAFLLTGSGFSASDVGSPVFAADSNTLTLTARGNVFVGEIIEYVSATQVWVKLHIGTFQPWMPLAAIQSVSGAGAANVTSYLTKWTTSSTDALTLANGTRAGQLKKIQMIVDGGTGTLTPTSLYGGTTITFADAGDFVVLVWSGSAWVVVEAGNDADGATAPVVA